MSVPATSQTLPEIVYPDSDGQPIADNTLQFKWIVIIENNLEALYIDEEQVFVAGDLLWYPREGIPFERCAPDILVVFGRPKGYRGSYQQWREAGIAPQVVFEILSPGNRLEEMDNKFEFYRRNGVEEYYLYDPASVEFSGWWRQGYDLQPIPHRHNWVSPRLGIRFDLSGPELVIYRPDGARFLTFAEVMQEKDQAWLKAEAERAKAEAERAKAETERAKAEAERAKAERLAAQLRKLGIEPEA